MRITAGRTIDSHKQRKKTKKMCEGFRSDEEHGASIGFGIWKHQTAKALLFEIDGEPVWVPESVLLDGPSEGEEGEVFVREWWAEKEGR